MSYAKNFLKMDKIDRLLDAMELPENYSPAEIESMLRDSETKEILDMLDRTKSSLQSIATPDVDAEWNRFAGDHNGRTPVSRRFRSARLFPRSVAASVAIVVVSLTAVATIVGVGLHRAGIRNRTEAIPGDNGSVPLAGTVVSQSDTVMSVAGGNEAVAGTEVFDNESFETILARMAAYYDRRVVFAGDNSKSLRLYFRWDRSLPLEEVLEQLNNFEQIHLTLDNDTIKVD